MSAVRVKFLKISAGPRGVRHTGTIHEVGETEAAALIADGAVEVLSAPPPEPLIEKAQAEALANADRVEKGEKIPPKPIKPTKPPAGKPATAAAP